MRDDEPPVGDDEVPPENVLVFRNSTGQPVIVPNAVATEAERAYRAYTMHVGGKSWQEIANEEKYPSAGSAKADVDRYMDEAAALVADRSARKMLNLEVTRLDALQAAIWPQAMAGHIPSAALVMNIVMNRSRLVGLDPEKMNEELNASARTVVVPGDTTSFIETMKRQAAQTGDTLPPG